MKVKAKTIIILIMNAVVVSSPNFVGNNTAVQQFIFPSLETQFQINYHNNNLHTMHNVDFEYYELHSDGITYSDFINNQDAVNTVWQNYLNTE